jgi:Domain of unknown function (DUF4864)
MASLQRMRKRPAISRNSGACRCRSTRSACARLRFLVVLLLLTLFSSDLFHNGCRAFQLTPSTPPQEIIQQQLQALQQDDMASVYQLASPNNKERTVDVTRFGQMVRSGPYKHLVRHIRSTVLLESNMAASQQFLVRIVPRDYEESGRIVEYWWSLSRCNGGEYAGSYMVDAVIPNQ